MRRLGPRDPFLTQDFILALPVLLFSLVAHEYAHGYAAFRQGDETALEMGRLTLNPLPHIDLFMSILIPAFLWFSSHGAFVFGGAKPIPVRPDKYRHYVRGDIIVSLAGVATNLAIALLCTGVFVAVGVLAREVPGGSGTIAVIQRMLAWGVALNLMLCLFNLIPIPPLDGSHVLFHLLPPPLRQPYRTIQRLGFLPLLALMLLFPGAIQVLLRPAYAGFQLFYDVASPFAAGEGWNIFSR